MPEMMSLTRVCEPKPTATPTTPAPAIRGAICTPSADSAIRIAVTASTTNEHDAQDRQQRAQPRPAPRLVGRQVGHAWPGRSAPTGRAAGRSRCLRASTGDRRPGGSRPHAGGPAPAVAPGISCVASVPKSMSQPQASSATAKAMSRNRSARGRRAWRRRQGRLGQRSTSPLAAEQVLRRRHAPHGGDRQRRDHDQGPHQRLVGRDPESARSAGPGSWRGPAPRRRRPPGSPDQVQGDPQQAEAEHVGEQLRRQAHAERRRSSIVT